MFITEPEPLPFIPVRVCAVVIKKAEYEYLRRDFTPSDYFMHQLPAPNYEATWFRYGEVTVEVIIAQNPHLIMLQWDVDEAIEMEALALAIHMEERLAGVPVLCAFDIHQQYSYHHLSTVDALVVAPLGFGELQRVIARLLLSKAGKPLQKKREIASGQGDSG